MTVYNTTNLWMKVIIVGNNFLKKCSQANMHLNRESEFVSLILTMVKVFFISSVRRIFT